MEVPAEGRGRRARRQGEGRRQSFAGDADRRARDGFCPFARACGGGKALSAEVSVPAPASAVSHRSATAWFMQRHLRYGDSRANSGSICKAAWKPVERTHSTREDVSGLCQRARCKALGVAAAEPRRCRVSRRGPNSISAQYGRTERQRSRESRSSRDSEPASQLGADSAHHELRTRPTSPRSKALRSEVNAETGKDRRT